MRILITIINLITLILIVITPGYFKDDDIALFDRIVVCLMLISTCYLFLYQKERIILLLSAVSGLLYCASSIHYGVEDEGRFNRICNIFSLPDPQFLIQPAIEWFSFISFLVAFILGLITTFKLIRKIWRYKLVRK